MQNKFIILVIFLIVFVSCKKSAFLDSNDVEVVNRELVFSDSARTMQFLTNLYVDLGFGYTLNGDNAPADFSKVCDEAEGRYPALGNFDKVVTQGTFAGNFYQQFSNHWSRLYTNIHNVNIYLTEVERSPLSASLKTRTKAEARFLRAFYYHFLLKYFGGVPLIGDKIYLTSDVADTTRATYADCIDYVVKELDEVANILPASYSGFNYGRITKGACLALKSRVLLFAASPLYNGGSTATTPELIAITAYPTYDDGRWEKARQAALDVINLGTYSLNIDNTTKPGNGFYKLFVSRVNNEFILPRPMPTGKQVESAFNPRSRGGGSYFYYPTQELVDMFPMLNGLPITSPGSGYNENNPYVNRDPRFGYTVIYNGSLYYLNSARALREINTYKGAASDGIVGISSNTATCTGYYNRKLSDEMAAVTGGSNVDRSLPIIRYGEILLNYAEASNEVGNTNDALNAIKQLRTRAGITAGAGSQYGLPTAPTKDSLRKLIQNERAIELAFEHHRFYDIRRWKIGAPLLDGKYVHGMEITRIGTTGSNYTYKRINVRTRYFKEIYYYWPIPTKDVTINPKLLQNPGY